MDEFFENCTHKIIVIDDKEVKITKSKNFLYNLALEYALENVNDWLVFRKKKNES